MKSTFLLCGAPPRVSPINVPNSNMFLGDNIDVDVHSDDVWASHSVNYWTRCADVTHRRQ
jgi:hypothetical protein